MKLEDMEAVVKRTRVIASTVGPFATYGAALVEACVKHGVDYVDITGTVPRREQKDPGAPLPVSDDSGPCRGGMAQARCTGCAP